MLHLDHVAIGLADAAPAIRTLVGEFGGTVLGGGIPPGSGFRAMQVHLGSPDLPGMTVELLEPHEVTHNDFLRRFVDRHGDGPHHLTFKTNDIAAELGRLRSLGIEPVGVNFSNPDWQEMFLHPKVAHGIVVQIAQAGDGFAPQSELIADRREHGPHLYEGHEWWGVVDRGDDVARLRRVVLGGPDPEATVTFYTETLYGEQHGERTVRWSGGELLVAERSDHGVIRLELEGPFFSQEVGGTLFRFGQVHD